jgi:hypothetical protein
MARSRRSRPTGVHREPSHGPVGRQVRWTGQVKYMRVWLEVRDVLNVLATKCNDTVGHRPNDRHPGGRTDRLACRPRLAAPLLRQRRTRPRVYDWARVPIRPAHPPGPGTLAAGPPLHQRRRDRLPIYVCYGPARATLNQLIAVAGSR